MAVTEGAIAHFAKRYQEVTGEIPKRFVCPITLQDDPNAELCYGHILCKKLKSASKLTVVQRADVDSRLGSYIESDFVTFANFRNAEQHEIIRSGKKLTITSPSGQPMSAFFAGDEAKVSCQQIEMYDELGNTVATPFLKSHTLEAGQYKQLQVQWMFHIHKYCFTAAMIKSAFLNMFRLLGYTWVLDTSGERVRRTLAASFEAPSRNAALDQYSDFERCCWVTATGLTENPMDSLGDNRLLFHFAEGDALSGLLFGVSSLFWINGALIAVTLPWCNRSGHYCVSWNYYQDFIAHQFCHNIYSGWVVDDAIRIDSNAMSFQIVDSIPPNNTFSRSLSPCPLDELPNANLTTST